MGLIRWFRSRLVVRVALTMLAVSLLPLAAAGLLLVGLTERSLAEQVRVNQRELAASSAVLVEQYIADARTKLRTVGRLAAGQPGEDKTAVVARLQELLGSGETFLDLKYYRVGASQEDVTCGQAQNGDYQAAQTKVGNNRAWQGPEEQQKRAQQEAPAQYANKQRADVRGQQILQTDLLNTDNLSPFLRNNDTVPARFDVDQLVFAKPLSGEDYLSPTIGLVDEIPFLTISIPFANVDGKKRVDAILVASVDLRPLLKRLAELAGPRRAIAINDGLTPLAASPPPAGPDVSSSTTPFGTGGWTVAIHESRESALAPLRAARAQSMAWVGGAGAASIAASFLLASWILRPVRRLTGAAHRMREGDLKARADVDRADEIGELGRAFDQMAAALEQLDRQKSDFVSHVSHELRTPLTSMKLSVANLLDGVVGPVDGRQEDVLRRVRVDLDRLIRMVNELLDLAKLEAGKIALERGPVDLAAVARDAAATVGPLAQARGVAVEVSGSSAPVEGDRAKLLQVAINLVDNAVKFSPAGGRVEVLVGERRLSVKDQGCGIDPAQLPRVFDAFAKVGDDRQPRPAGAGLGLSISRRLVELHGGRLAVESLPGRGSTFTVAL